MCIVIDSTCPVLLTIVSCRIFLRGICTFRGIPGISIFVYFFQVKVLPIYITNDVNKSSKILKKLEFFKKNIIMILLAVSDQNHEDIG